MNFLTPDFSYFYTWFQIAGINKNKISKINIRFLIFAEFDKHPSKSHSLLKR